MENGVEIEKSFLLRFFILTPLNLLENEMRNKCEIFSGDSSNILQESTVVLKFVCGTCGSTHRSTYKKKEKRKKESN